jgi:hydroxypyruvate reductase/glycerate 2-kinase
MNTLREHALRIWQTAVNAVRPADLIRDRAGEFLRSATASKGKILVVGAGKASAAMAQALESAIAADLERIEGIVNVPADCVRQLRKIQLHAARPAASNHPTEEGVVGANRMLDLFAHAGPEDVGICLISGGGSALLPAPVDGITLADKQAVTKLLHSCGASINEMNCVRKHLSRIKGGQLARAFTGKAIYSLIVSDVVGDPLEVIASGPTAADPATFADALDVLDRYRLRDAVSPRILAYFEAGIAGLAPETLKQLTANVHNCVIGNNQLALNVARTEAERLGYCVLQLGSFIEGETREVAIAVAGIVRSIRKDHQPGGPPVCILIGGETTVTLGKGSGKGGRNQEFVLAMLHKLGPEGIRDVAALSGGTDGEDGPTDAAGAFADEEIYQKAVTSGKAAEIGSILARHDAYSFFDSTGGLIRTGLTETNVMDVRVVLVR